MRSGYKLPRDFSIFILAALGLILFIRVPSLSADSVQQAQNPAGSGRTAGEDAEVIANLDFLESLEFLEEEAALVDDYEALDKWEGGQNVQ